MVAIYIESKIDNNRYCKTNGHFSRHLAKHKLTYKDYYEIYVTQVTQLCGCGKPLTFYQKDESYANSCGDPRCVGETIKTVKQNWTAEKRQTDSTNKRKAAVNRTDDQIADQIAKARDTFIKKYGVEWGSKTELQKLKSKKTKLERYGSETYNNSVVSSNKNRNKSVLEKDLINDKRRNTNLNRFGVENTFLLPESVKKSRQGNALGRDYILPSGRIVHVRGYEDEVLAALLQTYNESDLKIHNSLEEYQLPIFSYIDHRRHHLNYYPDIYIPKENKIIEVKSRWWWDGNGDPKYSSRLENNLRKRQSVLNKGYDYEVWLFEDKNDYKILKDDKDFQT